MSNVAGNYNSAFQKNERGDAVHISSCPRVSKLDANIQTVLIIPNFFTIIEYPPQN